MDELYSYLTDILGREPTTEEVENCLGMLTDGYSIQGYLDCILEEELAIPL